MNDKLITADMKIYNIVKKHPSLMEELIAQSPKFKKINNKILFNTMAKIASVRDAAKIGNLDLDELLLSLNRAINKEDEYLKEKESKSLETGEQIINQKDEDYPYWYQEKDSFKILDVREVENPYNQIIETADQTLTGEGFCIIQSFEPVPLFNALKKRGFDYASEKISGDEHRAYFYRVKSHR